MITCIAVTIVQNPHERYHNQMKMLCLNDYSGGSYTWSFMNGEEGSSLKEGRSYGYRYKKEPPLEGKNKHTLHQTTIYINDTPNNCNPT